MEILFRVEGRMSTFGGPKDKGMKPTEGLALFSSEQDMKNHGLGGFLLSQQAAGAPGLGRRLNPEKPRSLRESSRSDHQHDLYARLSEPLLSPEPTARCADDC
jgi:hypothetical protein